MRIKYFLIGLLLLCAVVTGLTLNFLRQSNVLPSALPPMAIQTSPNSSSTTPTSDSTSNPLIQNQIGKPFQLPTKLQMGIFADNLGKPRDLVFSPEGTLLVSAPDQGKVMALPDADTNGAADKTVVVLEKLSRPHGLVFLGDLLFVAEETQVNRYNWNEKSLTATFDKTILTLPGSLGGHNTRSLVFNRKGQLFITIGSTCNVCIEPNDWYAVVLVTDKDGSTPRVFAKGLRNSVFLVTNPNTDEIWSADMGRDNLGDDVPPEEINILRDNQNYGWPICYGNKLHDTQFDKNTYVMDPCAKTVAPIFQMQAHSAPLGLTFINSPQFPKDWQGDLLVSFHGSWNRSIPTGYKVVRLQVNGNTISEQSDFLTGFLQGNQAAGRPVDLVFDQQGSLYLSDDKAGKIYKIIASQ